MEAVVIEASDTVAEKYGWVGIRAAVESPPLWTPIQDPEEASPLPVQVSPGGSQASPSTGQSRTLRKPALSQYRSVQDPEEASPHPE